MKAKIICVPQVSPLEDLHGILSSEKGGHPQLLLPLSPLCCAP